jgi:hypothetical protein
MKGLWRFFPVQLLVLHLRKSHVLLFFWLILFAIIGRLIATRYGIPFLLLAPEYLGKVSFLSFLLTGLCLGLFIMSFHIASYIYYARKFPFLATLQRPIYQFSINNSVIPFIYVITHVVLSMRFQLYDENIPLERVLINLAALLLGISGSISVVFTYFFSINRNLINELGEALRPLGKIIRTTPGEEQAEEQVQTYLMNFGRVRYVRDIEHYPENFLRKVYRRQYRSASYFFFAILGIIAVLGLFRENPAFLIPAAASLFVLLAIYILFVAVVYSWVPRWYISSLILLLIAVNAFWKFDITRKENKIPGLTYQQGSVPYTNAHLISAFNQDSAQSDLEHHRYIHNRWHLQLEENKPPFIVINASGGGMRSVLFTSKVLQRADMYTEGEFFEHIRLITGASGGMIGAAFYRQLKVDAIGQEEISDRIREMGNDLLNPVIFTLITNDLFINTLKYESQGEKYSKDRGYAFEQSLIQNSGDAFRGSFRKLAIEEISGKTPLLIMTPTVINDGRHLIISPQPASFLTSEADSAESSKDIDAIEFSRMFREQGANQLHMSAALRMNASFPYITPLSYLPADPPLEIIDAGARDNTGSSTSTRYLSKMSDWIDRHCSRVIIVSIRSDEISEIEINETTDQSFLDRLLSPVGGVYTSYDNMQEYNEMRDRQLLKNELDIPVEEVEFRLFETEEGVSLSWHLTEREKYMVEDILYSEFNRNSFRKLQQLLQED